MENRSIVAWCWRSNVMGQKLSPWRGWLAKKQLDPIQEAIVQEGGVQCGFCTPGILISSHALLQRNPNPSEDEIREALVGNLCRCTGYVRIIESVKAAARMQSVTG